MATKEQFKFIDERFEQLINDSKDVAEKAAQLLFLANAGGAAATLSFLGAVSGIRLQWAPKAALILFVVGIIFVGIHMAIRIHHVDLLLSRFRHDVIKFYDDHLEWSTLTDADAKRSEKVLWQYLSGYASFGCFIAGTIVGLLFSTIE
jgi:hypothetical protein